MFSVSGSGVRVLRLAAVAVIAWRGWRAHGRRRAKAEALDRLLPLYGLFPVGDGQEQLL